METVGLREQHKPLAFIVSPSFTKGQVTSLRTLNKTHLRPRTPGGYDMRTEVMRITWQRLFRNKEKKKEKSLHDHHEDQEQEEKHEHHQEQHDDR